MDEETMEFVTSDNNTNIIKVMGVGGGGSNAVINMFHQGIEGVEFIICNTDSQALENSPIENKIQLGTNLTEGRGAGNNPEKGRQAAMEDLENVKKSLEQNTKMLFITAGMGGGTGTGAAPVIARIAKELGILTVGIVTIPFKFEGRQRIAQAIEGIAHIKKYVDSLLIIHNEKLREIYGDLKLSEAFNKADNILTIAAKGIAEIITVHGYVNVDFADVETVIKGSGVALMGTGIAEGENRATEAIRKALVSPLLNNNNLKGAKNILLNITSGMEEIRMDEIGEITDFVQKGTGIQSDIIWGNGNDDSLGKNISVTIIATGFNTEIALESYSDLKNKDSVYLLDDENEKEKIDTVEHETENTIENEESNIKPEENLSPSEDVSFTVTDMKGSEKDMKKTKKEDKHGKKTGVDEWFRKKFGGLFDENDTKL
ncbi:cell division protein FtsZ [Bacteroidota bacterium]